MKYAIVSFDAACEPQTEFQHSISDAKDRAREIAESMSFDADPVWCAGENWHDHDGRAAVGGYDVPERDGGAVVIYQTPESAEISEQGFRAWFDLVAKEGVDFNETLREACDALAEDVALGQTPEYELSGVYTLSGNPETYSP